MKLSQWHNGSVKPVHVGVYERDPKGCLGDYSYWTGTFWTSGFSVNDKESLVQSQKYKSKIQKLSWRGIVKDKK